MQEIFLPVQSKVVTSNELLSQNVQSKSRSNTNYSTVWKRRPIPTL